MLFIASPTMHEDELARWPALVSQHPGGARVVELTPQARRLACLLAIKPEGMSAKDVGLALGGPGSDGKGSRRNALVQLRQGLARVGLDELLVIPNKGGPASPPWVLRETTYDIELARDATANGAWEVAAKLTYGGEGFLVGIQSPTMATDHWIRAVSLAGIRHARSRSRWSLPAELVDTAKQTASRVRLNRAQWQGQHRTSPPAETRRRADAVPRSSVELDRGDASPLNEHVVGEASSPAPSLVPTAGTLAEIVPFAQASLRVMLAPAEAKQQRYEVIVLRLSPPYEPVDRSRRPHRAGVPRRAFVVLAVAVALLTLGALELYGVLPGLVDQEPGPISQQLNRVIAEAKSEGLSLAAPIRTIDARADGTSSRVMVLRPADSRSRTSDEIRIYDTQTDQHLRLAFSFRPQARRSAVEAQRQQTPAATPPRSFAIRVSRVANLDGLPGVELLVDVAEYAVQPIWPRPLYIYWDAERERYRLAPLLSPATTGRATMRGLVTRSYSQAGTYGRALVDDVYSKPTTLIDAVGGNPPVSAYAVEAYLSRPEDIVDPRGTTAGGMALLAGYVVRAQSPGTAELMQIIRWHINLRAQPPTAQAPPGRRTVVDVGIESSHLDDLLRRSWR